MSTPEMGFNPELQPKKLPENPADYEGDLNTPKEGETKLESATKLWAIYDAADQEQRD